MVARVVTTAAEVPVSSSVRRRRAWPRITLATLAAVVVACGDRTPIDPVSTGTDGVPRQETLPADSAAPVAAPVLSSMAASPPMLALCAAPVEYRLTNLRETIGTVRVANDAKQLSVTYSVTAKDWYLTDTRLAVARSYLEIPQDARRVPLPWSFPHAGVHVPAVKTQTYALPLADLKVVAGQQLVVAAMAGVVHPKTSSPAGPWEWLVMWGIGNVSGSSFETAHNYTVAGCAGQPAPTPAPNTGRVTITFDDGWRDTYTNAYPVLEQLGLKGNVAIYPQPIDGGWSAFMTLAQVKELHRKGWSVVSHSVSHRDLTTLTPAELTTELRDSKRWIEENGFGPARTFVVPFHAWGMRERTEIEKHYARARGYAVNQFVPFRFTALPVSSRPFEVYGYEPEFAPYTTAAGRATTLQIVERAVTSGTHVDIFFHRIPDEQLGAFRTLMQDIARYKANVVTWQALE